MKRYIRVGSGHKGWSKAKRRSLKFKSYEIKNELVQKCIYELREKPEYGDDNNKHKNTIL